MEYHIKILNINVETYYWYEKCPFIYLSGKKYSLPKRTLHYYLILFIIYVSLYVQAEIEMETRIIQQTLIKLSLEIQLSLVFFLLICFFFFFYNGYKFRTIKAISL